MESKTKKRIIILLVVAAIAAVAIYFFWPQEKEITFNTKVIAIDTVESNVTATGSVAPVDEVTVGTQVSGIVTKVYVDYNSHVKKGQILAELDKSTLQERLNQANAQLQSALSALTLAQQNYTRTKTLYDQKAATKSDLEDVENALTQARSSVTTAKTSVSEAKVNLGYAEIYSPISGVVLGKEVEEGQTVASSFSTPTLFTIAKDLKNMQVEANIDEADIGQVKVGQKVTFTVDSYIGLTFEGKVAQVRMNPTTTNNVVTYTVIITAPNNDEKLMPGMTANITIVTEQHVDLVVPVEACNFTPTDELMAALAKPDKKGKPGEGKDSMFVPEKDATPTKGTKTVWIKNGNSLHPVQVKVGMNDGVNYIVKSGLAAGDTVVLKATVGVKEKAKTGGSNPLMPTPPKHGNKNSSKQGGESGPGPQ